MCTRARSTPSALARRSMASRWSMCECTLPSESRPRKWRVPRRSITRSVSVFQVAPSNSAPLSTASCTSLAPCENTCPEPMALWPTSELPMSPSLGMPTAEPCALSCVAGPCLSWSRCGVAAAATMSPASPPPMPTPSMMARTTGPLGPEKSVRLGSFIASGDNAGPKKGKSGVGESRDRV